MDALRRSWVVIGLWIASSLLAVLFPTEIVNGRDLFLNLSYLFGSLLIISYLWARFSLLGLRVTRELDSPRAQVGRYAEETITVENYSILPKLYLEVRDYSDLPFHRASRVLSWLPGHSRHSWTVRTPCYQRGRFHLGPLTLCSSDPFGLFFFRRDIQLRRVLTVYPPAVALPGFSPEVAERSGNVQYSWHTYEITSNVAGVREYAPGDSFNRIHWPSSARVGRLIVKEFERNALADVWLFLDMEQQVHVARQEYIELEVTLPATLHVLLERPETMPFTLATQEYAVTAAASLARYFLERNWPLGLVTYARDQRRTLIQLDHGPRQLDHLLALLAVVQPLGSVPLARMLEAESIYLTRNALAIIITPSVHDLSWVAAVQQLHWRGVRVMAIIIDPASFVPESASSGAAEMMRATLLESNVLCFTLRLGDRLPDVLS